VKILADHKTSSVGSVVRRSFLAAKNCAWGFGSLSGFRIDGNNFLRPAVLILQPLEECGKFSVAVVQPDVCGTTIRRPRAGGFTLRPIPIC
jgi:hypothetical protein